MPLISVDLGDLETLSKGSILYYQWLKVNWVGDDNLSVILAARNFECGLWKIINLASCFLLVC